jgi:cysteine-rich repeat protein
MRPYPLLRSILCALLVSVVPACGDDDGGNQTNQNQNGNLVVPICGNGIVEAGEQCDEGAANSDSAPDACRTSCRLAYCGDFAIDTGEACDDGPQNGRAPSRCHEDCTLNVCGDGVVLGDEVCDDGNTEDDDDCRGDCSQDFTLCGNAVIDPGEGCDLGDGVNSNDVPDTCRVDCQPPRCGDGVRDSGEACDDGNTVDDLTCSATCQNRCGDGVINPNLGEECDAGDGVNGVSPSRCKDGCVATWCGDGFLGGGMEQCDDGNDEDGDGCDASCEIESRYACTGSPSTCACAGFAYGPTCEQCVVFVSPFGGFVKDGRSWATAFGRLQDAVDAAASAGEPCEVWAAGGTYWVYEANQLDTLELRDDVTVLGGFAGNETDREARNPAVNFTNIIGNNPANEAEVVFHVVTAMGTKAAVLDGFTIQNGKAIGLAAHLDDRGGGLLAYAAELTVERCRIERSAAETYGGGAYVFGGAGVVFRDAVFHVNTVGRYGMPDAHLTSGGGLFVHQAEVALERVTFTSNQAGSGGALGVQTGKITAVDSTFEYNSGLGFGGAVHAKDSDLAFTGGRFTSNSSLGGGAMAASGAELVRLEGVRFEGNTGAEGGALRDSYSDAVQVLGCTFQGNSGGDGGALWARNDSVFEVRGSTFSGNSANGSGGALCLSARPGSVPGVAVVSDCTFLGNEAAGQGGAIGVATNADGSVDGLPLLIDRSRFRGNRAHRGAAVFLMGHSDYPERRTRVSRSLFVGNLAREVAALYLAQLNADVVGCTFVGNQEVDAAAPSGAAFYLDSETGQPFTYALRNLVLHENEPVDYGMTAEAAAHLDRSYSLNLGTCDHCLTGTPVFARAPLAWDRTSGPASASTLTLYAGPPPVVGAVLELDGDGVARTVTQVAGALVTFTPSLATEGTHPSVVAIWPAGTTDVTPDLHLHGTSPGLDAGSSCADPDAGCGPVVDLLDLEGTAPVDHGAVGGTGGPAPITYLDMGCYETGI